jgi:ABC-2 type transport system permease protein
MTAWLAVVRVLFGSILTKGRLVALLALGSFAVVVGFAVGRAGPTSPTIAGADLVNAYGLSLLAPVVTLVLASATFGDTIDDNTLGYLWLRPVPRSILVTAAMAAALVAAAPVVVVPLVVAALLTGGGVDLAIGTTVSALVAVVGYGGLFVALGSMFRRALAWGILYIVIWEGFIARAGASSSRFSIQYYARSLLADIANVSLRLGDAPTIAAVVVPVGVAIAGIAAATVRLHRINVA